MSETILTIIIPCCNSEEVLDQTIPTLRSVLLQACKKRLIGSASTLLLVDGGSTDRTWRVISSYVDKYREVTGLKPNCFGRQEALIAGMDSARAYSDCVITIDAELQNDIRAIPDFLKKYREGCEIVDGISRKSLIDPRFKRNTVQLFYKMMQRLGVPIESDSVDFRLLGRRALEQLSQLKATDLLLPGTFSLPGLKSGKVLCIRKSAFSKEEKAIKTEKAAR